METRIFVDVDGTAYASDDYDLNGDFVEIVELSPAQEATLEAQGWVETEAGVLVSEDVDK